MSELISGKEAWIALYDGFDIQIRLKDVKHGWLTIKQDSLTLSNIKSEHYEYRLKPTTTKLNIKIEKPKEIVLCGITGAVGLVYGNVAKAKGVQAALREVFK